MADIGWITRPGDDLMFSIGDPCSTFNLIPDGFDPGTPKVRRQTAESFYETDATQVSVREGMASGGLRFFVVADDQDGLQDGIEELVAALKQETFDVYIQPDGLTVPYAHRWWHCEVAVGFPAPMLMGRWAPVSVSSERESVPVSGPAI